MTKSVAIIGTSGAINSSYAMSTGEIFEATGHNTGNLAFQYAAWQLLDEEKRLFTFQFDPHAVRESCRLIMLPAANFLYSGFDLEDLARRLDATGLPVVVLGLGAQAFRSIAEVQLKPGTERLLRVMSERCETIAVRGKYTAGVLERYGVHNFEVLGCPSNLINPSLTLGRDIAERLRRHSELVAYCPTFYSYNADFEEKLYRSFADGVAQIVCQDPIAAVALARGDNDAGRQWLDRDSGFLVRLPESERHALISRMRTYLSVDAWLEAYRAMDLVVGSRIHGVNIGWQAGRAALVVSFDLRTEELADTMGVPWIKAAEMPTGPGAMHLVRERVERAAETYDARRTGLAARFAALLQRSGLTVSARLQALHAPPPAAASPGPAGRGASSWGFLEQYNREHIAGWVESEDGRPPEVVVRLDGREIGTCTASTLRPDLGPNARGFHLAPPADALVRDVMQVEVTFAATGAHLKNSPVTSSFRADDDRKVLRGRNGYLFLQNDSNDVLRQITGERVLSGSELDRWANFFVSLDQQARAGGARAVLLVAPNKECVFAEHLPDGLRLAETRPVRQLEQLLASLRLGAVELAYPLATLRAATAFDAYPKGDSHWTDYGAAVVLDQLWPLLWPGRRNERPAVESGFRTEFRNSDLLSKLGGTCVEAQPVAVRRPRDFRLEATNSVGGTGRIQRFRSTLAGAAGDLLLAHDSFGDWLIPHLAESAASLQTSWGAGLPADWLAAGGQRTVLVERAERFLVTPSSIEC